MKTIGSVLIMIAVAGISQAQSPVVDPQAEAVLRALSERNGMMQSAVFRVADTIDEVQPDGSKLQFAHVREFTVFRPDKLKIETCGDVMSRVLWKDGKTLTVLDRNANVYAGMPDPGTIDETVDLLQEKYGMGLPGADVLTTNLYAGMTKDCEAVEYVGTGYVREEKCHHIAFYRGNIDWQMWISMGDKPELRKMVIIYKQLPGEPQYSMELISIEKSARIDEAVFTPVIPEGTERIEIQPVAVVETESVVEEK